MASGREWALQTLGSDGVLVREQVQEIILQCHEQMANAQAEAQMNHSGPYSYIWLKCLNEFSSKLGRLPSAEIVPLYRTPYKLVSVGGVIVFPWRFGRDANDSATDSIFAISGTRERITKIRPTVSQPRLDIEFEHPELSEEELQIADDRITAELAKRTPLVVVGYASNPTVLHQIVWGEAVLQEDRRLKFSHLEVLHSANEAELVGVGGAAFDEGEIPRPQFGDVSEGTSGQ